MWTARRSPGLHARAVYRWSMPMNGDTCSALSKSARPAGQDVRVPLAPRRVRDLGDDRLDVLARPVQAVVEADRVEVVAERAELGEQPDRPARPEPRLLSAPCLAPRGPAGLRPAPGSRGAGSADSRAARHEPAAEQRRQLVEVEVEQRQAVAELAPRLGPPVADRALVDAARGRESQAPAEPLGDPERAADAVLVEPPAPVGATEMGPPRPADLREPRLRLRRPRRCTPGGRSRSSGSPWPGRSRRSG